jgi:hypothetical protein
MASHWKCPTFLHHSSYFNSSLPHCIFYRALKNATWKFDSTCVGHTEKYGHCASSYTIEEFHLVLFCEVILMKLSQTWKDLCKIVPERLTPMVAATWGTVSRPTEWKWSQCDLHFRFQPRKLGCLFIICCACLTVSRTKTWVTMLL